jgi:hypothetical protein
MGGAKKKRPKFVAYAALKFPPTLSRHAVTALSRKKILSYLSCLSASPDGDNSERSTRLARHQILKRWQATLLSASPMDPGAILFTFHSARVSS